LIPHGEKLNEVAYEWLATAGDNECARARRNPCWRHSTMGNAIVASCDDGGDQEARRKTGSQWQTR
jgi:hypothetical protein